MKTQYTTNTHIIISFDKDISLHLPLCLGKFLVVLFRFIKDKDGKCVYSFQEISTILGHSGRQWSNNIFSLWEQSGENLYLFIEDKRKTSKEILNLIEKFVIAFPLKSILEQHREFIKVHSEYSSIGINMFRDYVSAIDCSKLITIIRKQVQDGKLNPKSSYFINVLLSEGKKISSLQKEYISDLLPTTQNLLPIVSGKDIDWSNKDTQKYMLVYLLYIYGVSQDKLALLFGVSKGSIHNWVHKYSKDMKFSILKMITSWSGKICVDEKWIRVAGVWHFVLTAVDAQTGIALLSQRFDRCDSATWILFFKEFKIYYGVPKLITSDGSSSLLIGINHVFKGVRHQLCWFHKLKNLHKRIYQIEDGEIRQKAFFFANGMFNNKHVSSRKKAARRLALLDVNIAKYITKSIIGPWLKLTCCLTSNAAERYNRKIEKCIKGRYGVKNEKCADNLIYGLWFSDLLMNGKVHCGKFSKADSIDFPKIIKANFEKKEILHFSKNNKFKTNDMAA